MILRLRLQSKNQIRRTIVNMKRECDMDNMIAAKHAKATALTRGAIKVEYTVINRFIPNESVTYHCWTENYEDGKANAYINSTCVPSTVRITFIPCDSKEQYQREHPSCKLVITFHEDGGITFDESIRNGNINRYLPQITRENPLTLDHPHFRDYCEMEQSKDSRMTKDQHKLFIYGEGTGNHGINMPRGWAWNSQINGGKGGVQEIRSEERPPDKTALRAAWEYMVHKYDYKHETSGPGTKDWREWNDDNNQFKDKGNRRCTNKHKYRQWEAFVMEQWMIEYFQTTEKPKRSGSLLRAHWDFHLNEMLKKINAVRTKKGWPEVHFET